VHEKGGVQRRCKGGRGRGLKGPRSLSDATHRLSGRYRFRGDINRRTPSHAGARYRGIFEANQRGKKDKEKRGGGGDEVVMVTRRAIPGLHEAEKRGRGGTKERAHRRKGREK